jgi:hypothetical protein
MDVAKPPLCPIEAKPKSVTTGSQMVAGAVGFVARLAAGWYAVLSGVHGGSPWPTAIIGAPASLLSALLFHDGLGYVAGMMFGTAMLWCACGVAVARNPKWAWLVIALFHAVCVAVLASL